MLERCLKRCFCNLPCKLDNEHLGKCRCIPGLGKPNLVTAVQKQPELLCRHRAGIGFA